MAAPDDNFDDHQPSPTSMTISATNQLSHRKSANGYPIADTPATELSGLSVRRKAYNTVDFNDQYDRLHTTKTLGSRLSSLRPRCSGRACFGWLAAIFPILEWLPQYDLRDSLLVDIVVGVTVAVFQVPQGMGYALTAHLPPVYGIYSAFFPPLVYIFMGGGHHVSVGTYAITSGLMTGDIVVAVTKELGLESTLAAANYVNPKPNAFADIQNIDIAIMIALVIGVYMLAFGALRLGFISNFLPDELISGFITAAGIITFTSQVRYMLGVNLTSFTGMLAFPRVWIEIFARIGETNLAALAITGVSLLLLIVVKYVLDVRLRRIGFNFPIPIDLIILIVGTVVSSRVGLAAKYKVQTVGNIPQGFPIPVIPKFKLFPYVWSRCISVAIVSYVTTISVGKIYGPKHGYAVENNQELIALGATNFGSAFFQCMPSAASLPRSALTESAGGKSQVVFIVNCVCLVAVILTLGPLLEPLPTAILGSCIAVAVASLMAKIVEFKRYWNACKLDGALWMITFASTLVLNVDYGIYIGFGCSILLLIYKSQRPKSYILGAVNESDIYVPINKYGKAKEIANIAIYQFCGALNFSNVELFKSDLQLKIGIDIDKLRAKLIRLEKKSAPKKNSVFCCFKSPNKQLNNSLTELRNFKTDHKLPSLVIIDCSMFSHIDTSGVSALMSVIKRLKAIGVNGVLAGCPVHVERMLEVVGFYDDLPASAHLYKGIHDAVIHFRQLKPTVEVYECHV